MLALSYLRDHKEEVLEGLRKRNFDRLELIDEILELDQQRRDTQTTLDAQLARANQLAKEIGPLFQSGQAEKAAPLKEEASALKNSTKEPLRYLIVKANAAPPTA